MSLSNDEVRKIASLARLRIDDGDIVDYAAKLSSILELVGQLQATDTAGVTPMAHPLDATQRLRADEVTETNRREDYQKNAPLVERGLYLVPRVIE